MCADLVLFPSRPIQRLPKLFSFVTEMVFSIFSVVFKFLRVLNILDLFAKCVRTAFILEDPTRLANDRTDTTSSPPTDGSPATAAAASGATAAVGGWADAGEESAYAWVLVRLYRLHKKK